MNVMNRKYIPVGMEIVEFEVEDIITDSTSSGGGNEIIDDPDEPDF